jgi:uncharacterized protein
LIGVSFYLNDPLAEQRLIAARCKGVQNAFTSLHIPEESGDLTKRARHLLEIAKEQDIAVYADVSKRTCQHLGISDWEQLRLLGVVSIRLDDFFDTNTILELSKQFRISINASIMSEDELIALLNRGLQAEQLIAWHNFYPRRETGLDEAFFAAQCQLFQKYKVPIAAFIPGRGEKRGPLFEGLPTLESHRDIDPFVAAIDLYRYGVSDVYVGDPQADNHLLEQLLDYEKTGLLPLRVQTDVLASGEYQTRPDVSRDVIRFMNTRSEEAIPRENSVDRPRGTVTVDNDGYGRYRGEVQITLRFLAADPRVNVIGQVIGDDLPLLSFVHPKQRIHLQCIANEQK